jgi:hypothetical protein
MTLYATTLSLPDTHAPPPPVTHLLHMDGYVEEVQDLVHGTRGVDQALQVVGHTRKQKGDTAHSMSCQHSIDCGVHMDTI